MSEVAITWHLGWGLDGLRRPHLHVWCLVLAVSTPVMVHVWDGSSLLYGPFHAPKTGLLHTRGQQQKLHGFLRPWLSAVGAQLALGWGALNLSMFTLLQVQENHATCFPN